MDIQKIRSRKNAIIGIAVFLAAAVILILNLLNEYKIEFNIRENEIIVIEYGMEQEALEVEAVYKGNLLYRAGKHVDVKAEGEVNYDEIGTYDVVYTASYKDISASVKAVVEVRDSTPPEIRLVVNEDSFTSPIEEYVEEGYFAVDNYDGDLTSSVIREEKEGVVYYTVTDSFGNTATAERKIVYKDAVAPVITLNGGNEIKWGIGTEYEDPGYTAADDCDGDITGNVTVEGSVEAEKYGEYTLVYKVKDSYGNICEAERKVTVTDVTPPQIELKGESTMYIALGERFSDPGCSASDDIDGDLTSKVKVNGNVDTNKAGVYKVTYEVSDSCGNKKTMTRTVSVYQKQDPAVQVQPGSKVVYLTFDDGPGKYTEQLLNILDKYGVKVTFFVTNQYPDYQHLIGEAHRRGHTIAMHTYSHNYSHLYSSEQAYYEDLNKIKEICVAQTGVEPNIVRFPGGTNNTISENHCQGIMTALTQSLPANGYYYTDWNVASGDAGGTSSREGVFNNVISGIQKYTTSVVLQHDIKGYSVEAVEDIITWGLANGYTFLPMTESSKMVHFKPNN
uniref:immunoglobulin-like domain-containing protein n=1 Tax=Agathobacter sp. TaxID=2021311 RepID=UPI0040576F56